jgi:hypothetical protein
MNQVESDYGPYANNSAAAAPPPFAAAAAPPPTTTTTTTTNNNNSSNNNNNNNNSIFIYLHANLTAQTTITKFVGQFFLFGGVGLNPH